MPGRAKPFRITKANHPAARHKRAMATVAVEPTLDLAELRQAHPAVTDQQATIVADVVLRSLSPAESAAAQGVPLDWTYSQLSKGHVASFMQALGLLALQASAHTALGVMTRLTTHARSSYVRYSAAQDLMDRAGLRATPQRTQANAASITINVGVSHGAAGNPIPDHAVTIDQEMQAVPASDDRGAPDEFPPLAKTV